MTRDITPSAFVAAALLLAGCAIGPNHMRPATQTPPTYRDQPAPSTPSLADLPWWEIYKDPQLATLIREALDANYDLRRAVSRIEQADAVAAQSRGQLFPQVGYQYGANRGRVPGVANPNLAIEDNSSAMLNAAWEVDLWGQLRRLHEADVAKYLATEEAQRGVTISLVAGVAQAYFELLALDLQLDIARQTTNSFGESLRIFTERFQGGVVSELETARAKAALANAAAHIPDLERQIAIQENQINVLLGRNPGPAVRSSTLLQQQMPPEVPSGIPSALLERRPDIRQAEETLRAANAMVGVSQASFLPRFNLTGNYGAVSPDLDAFSSDSEESWSVGGTATGPLFEGGRLKAQYRQASAARDEAKIAYEQAVLNALQEVSAALVSREKFTAVREQEELAVGALQTAVRIATARYVAGKASYYEVLEAQQQLFPAQNALAQTQLNQLLVIVQLYKALGGGWETDAAPK
jgi:outer membrane protein, multidrug efflux system